MPAVELVSVDEMVRSWSAAVVSVPVHVVVPPVRPVEFLRTWRVGGAALSRVLDEPIVSGQAWAASAGRAEEIASAWKSALLNDVSGMPLVRSVEVLSGPYFDPDPESKSPCYTVSVRLRVRGKRT